MTRRRTKPQDDPHAELRDADRGERLHKALAAAGVGSRRAIEEMIEDGRIAVNGATVRRMPIWVDPQRDKVTIDGRRVGAKPTRSTRYIMVNKPRGVISTTSDPRGRAKVTDLVPHQERLFCVGRLDAESNGLVLLTNDGKLTQRLMHPRYEVPKTYRVTIKGRLDEQAVAKLTEGIWLADKAGKTAKAHAAQVKLISRDRDRSRLQITLTEGRNREIRRMLVRLGYPVKRFDKMGV